MLSADDDIGSDDVADSVRDGVEGSDICTSLGWAGEGADTEDLIFFAFFTRSAHESVGC